MNLAAFFEHWGIAENPFRGEEARQDPVFLRLESGEGGSPRAETGADGGAAPVAVGGGGAAIPTHADFEKIVGDFRNPASSIVFGEKGSGKTAIRLQLADRLESFNKKHPAARCLLDRLR